MRKLLYKKGRKVVPTLIEYTGEHEDTKPEMQLFVYNSDELSEYEDIKLSQLDKHMESNKNNWINLHGLAEIELIKEIGEKFSIDDFILGDILNILKRSKVDEYNHTLFFNIKSLLPESNGIDVEQISFILRDGLLFSFQEKRSDFFKHIRERMRQHSGIVRDRKVDYLLYLLLDAVMENFYITIESEEHKIDNVIDLIKTKPNPRILEDIELHRDNLNFLRRSIVPLRDSLYSIKSMKDDDIFNVITIENYTFFARLHQKCLELLDQVDADLSSLESASAFYFSMQSHKMNEVMKTLTVVSVFFMPLTFIVGVYGMNFENMPELKWEYGYFYVLAGMFLLFVAMIIYFKKRRWF
ncbi:magnesium/cobalt transporter CorA [Flavobacterium terrigena]|uniref:Magnesium transport protein CorA n=1 Tax=Flavobacterium terrigena TaxID=402734 RepID=A0A1H6UB74_9FLAO|nr:magnesium/cobalt transporter CorA [Flavobacterium terrigena]SEI89609.1 magnesium transporter [Flavobacterium terrigena]